MSKIKPLRSCRTVLDIITVLAIVLMVVIFAQTAGIQPAPSVEQLGWDNDLLRYGVRTLLLGLFLAGCGVIGLLFLVSRFPRLYRYPVEITPQNIETQYVIAKIMLSSIQLACAVYTCILMVGVYEAVLIIPSGEFVVLTAVTGVVCGAVLCLYLVAARVNK